MPTSRIENAHYVNPPAPLNVQINALGRLGVNRNANYMRGSVSMLDNTTWDLYALPVPVVYVAWFTGVDPLLDPIAVNPLTNTDGSEAGFVSRPSDATHWTAFYSGAASVGINFRCVFFEGAQA